MPQHMGFPNIWLSWICSILSSSSSAILLNGIPGKFFKCKRGVHQGDLLSPLLFVLAAELLQVLINRASNINLFKAPIPHADGEFPIIQYADDTLLLLQADARQLFFLKALLHSFETSLGLKVNYRKSQLIPINVSQEKTQLLANTLACQIGSFPFTYLGLPMGTTKPRINRGFEAHHGPSWTKTLSLFDMAVLLGEITNDQLSHYSYYHLHSLQHQSTKMFHWKYRSC